MALDPRIVSNVQKMVDKNAPANDIDGYLNQEGLTSEQFKLGVSTSAPLQSKQRNYALSEIPAAAYKNAPESGGKFISGIADAIMHPINTIDAVATMGAGGLRKVLPESVNNAIDKADVAVFGKDIANKYHTGEVASNKAVGQYVKERAGSAEAIKRTLAEDPVGALMDISALATGGGSLATKAGQVGNISKANQIGNMLNKTAEVINPVSQAINLTGATTKALGINGKLANALKVSPEVADLYLKAKEKGIDIPLDRLLNKKPLNAVADSLNYVPFSGRAGTEASMLENLNKALSGTFGQNTSNVTQGLRNAKTELGAKFENTLKNNNVIADDTFVNDLGKTLENANSELVGESAQVIKKQVDNILSKVDESGNIDAQAAYNIKKRLDILEKNPIHGHYAKDLKIDLMGALNRSLGEKGATEFAKTRQQYSNMKALENLATNGAEGEISAARLANMKNINNPQLQELADISAQFIKPREGSHGSAQRAVTGGVLAGMSGPVGVATAIGTTRLANTLLNSEKLKNIAAGLNKSSQSKYSKKDIAMLSYLLSKAQTKDTEE